MRLAISDVCAFDLDIQHDDSSWPSYTSADNDVLRLFLSMPAVMAAVM